MKNNYYNTNTTFEGNYLSNLESCNKEMEEIEKSIPISRETINQTPCPTMLNYNSYAENLNPNEFIIQDYKDRSVCESNVCEFWAPVGDNVVPNIVPGRYWVSTWGRTWNVNTQKPMGMSVHGKGYYQVHFNTIDGKTITRKLHRVIQITFCYIDNYKKYEVNHKDSIRNDNRIYNLEWMTPSENTIYGINHGYKKVFGHDYSVELTEDQVRKIVSLHFDYGMDAYAILDTLNLFDKVSPITIELVWGGHIRTNITGKMDK